MKTKHTEGKWKVDDSSEYNISVVSPWTQVVTPANTMTFGDYRGALICEMHYNSGVPTKEQALANAKLIASAPDLLEALDHLLETMRPHIMKMGIKKGFSEHAALTQAQTAIHKATE